MKSFVRLCAFAVTFLLAAALPVAAVTWTFVQDVLIEENQGNPSNVRITGSFDYDSVTQSFSNIDLIVTNTGPFDNNNVASLTYDGTYDVFESQKNANDTEFFFSTSALTAGGLTGYLTIKFSAPLLNGYDPAVEAAIVAASAAIGDCKKFDNATMACTQIEPNGAAGSGANITSPGLLTNVAQVPLPLTMPLLLASLGGLAFLSRNRRKKAA
jgi:hypothetical protein